MRRIFTFACFSTLLLLTSPLAWAGPFGNLGGGNAWGGGSWNGGTSRGGGSWKGGGNSWRGSHSSGGSWSIGGGGVIIRGGSGGISIQSPGGVHGGHRGGYDGGYSNKPGGKILVVPGKPWPPKKFPPRPWPPASGGGKVSPPIITPTRSNPPTQSTPRPDPPVKPDQNVPPQPQLPPPATDPESNDLKTEGRKISTEEIAKAKDFFQKRFKECAASIESELPAIDCDHDKLMELFVTHQCSAETQIRILDALRAGDCQLARKIWIVILPDVECPFRESRLRMLFGGFCTKLHSGTCTHQDYLVLEQQFTQAGFAERRCCGAPSLLEDLEEFVQISELMQQAEPVPAAQSQQQSNIAPTGETDVIYHPRLPEGSLVVLNDDAVMVGTGGLGKLRTQQTSVAQAQGYADVYGKALPHSDLSPIRSGILIVNDSAGPVNFTIDNAKFSLQAGQRRRFPQQKAQIAFDRGTRKTLRHKLVPGTYKFGYANGAWTLYNASQHTLTIDNSNNPDAFHYIVQGEKATVEPYAKATHTSIYPLTVRFDRGNGRQIKQVCADQKRTTLQVAVSPVDNQWDLFQLEAPAAAITSSTSTDTRAADADFVPAF